MDINSLIQTFTTAVSSQADLDAWAVTQYGQGVAVYENIDLRNPPPPDDCPLVVFSHAEKTGGMQTSKSHVIGVDILVHDDRVDTDDNGVVIYYGGRTAETLRQRVLAKITDIIPGNLFLESVTVQYDPIAQFPYMFVDMTLTILEENLIGSNPFE